LTPRDVDALTDDEYEAFVAYMREEAREMKRASRRRGA
jgi:hypothetical protein